MLDPEGSIKLKGRGMVLSNNENFGKVTEWIDSYLTDPAETTYVTFCLEYLNSYCTAKLVTILQKISEVIGQNKKLVVYWYYEEDDNDILERGEYISETLKIGMEFIETDDIKKCS
jgi:hypothetical protein